MASSMPVLSPRRSWTTHRSLVAPLHLEHSPSPLRMTKWQLSQHIWRARHGMFGLMPNALRRQWNSAGGGTERTVHTLLSGSSPHGPSTREQICGWDSCSGLLVCIGCVTASASSKLAGWTQFRWQQISSYCRTDSMSQAASWSILWTSGESTLSGVAALRASLVISSSSPSLYFALCV